LSAVQVPELRLGPRRYLTGKASCSPDQDQSDDGPAPTGLPRSGRDAHERFSAQ